MLRGLPSSSTNNLAREFNFGDYSQKLSRDKDKPDQTPGASPGRSDNNGNYYSVRNEGGDVNRKVLPFGGLTRPVKRISYTQPMRFDDQSDENLDYQRRIPSDRPFTSRQFQNYTYDRKLTRVNDSLGWNRRDHSIIPEEDPHSGDIVERVYNFRDNSDNPTFQRSDSFVRRNLRREVPIPGTRNSGDSGDSEAASFDFDLNV